jgi:hypothetical protein
VDLVDQLDLGHHVDLVDRLHQPYREHQKYQLDRMDLVDRLDQSNLVHLGYLVDLENQKNQRNQSHQLDLEYLEDLVVRRNLGDPFDQIHHVDQGHPLDRLYRLDPLDRENLLDQCYLGHLADRLHLENLACLVGHLDLVGLAYLEHQSVLEYLGCRGHPWHQVVRHGLVDLRYLENLLDLARLGVRVDLLDPLDLVDR